MNPSKDVRQGDFGHMQETGVRPDAVKGADILQLIKLQDGDRPPKTTGREVRHRRTSVRDGHVKSLAKKDFCVLSSAAPQLKHSCSGRQALHKVQEGGKFNRAPVGAVGLSVTFVIVECLGIERQGLSPVSAHPHFPDSAIGFSGWDWRWCARSVSSVFQLIVRATRA